MVAFRIIPRLDIKGPNLVKGIHFEGLRSLGSAEDFAKLYYEEGADELMYVDVVASLYDRNSLHDVISRTASKSFIPITVSGGIRTIEDIKKVLRAGADKVSINTAAVNNPEFVRTAARMFGSSTIVVTIEAQKNTDGTYRVLTNNGREETGLQVKEWASQVYDYGAGEIVVSSVDQEGTGQGYDVGLIKLVSGLVTVPVIAHGGGGTLEHIRDTYSLGYANAVAVASMLHYESVNRIESTQSESEGNFVFANSKRNYSKVNPITIPEVKRFLDVNDIECRF